MRVESGELLAELGLMLTDDGVANRQTWVGLRVWNWELVELGVSG